MDQEQAGTAAVPCAGPEEGADGNAVGLPDLQPAVLDPPVQATHNPSSYLKEQENIEEDGDASPSKSQIQLKAQSQPT
jgi:hypothetical protein